MGLEQRLGCEHAVLHSGMRAFDLCAVTDSAAAFEHPANLWTLFPTLKFLKRIQTGVVTVQCDHESQLHLMVFRMVQEPAALGAIVLQPAEGVDNGSRLVLLGPDRPDLLVSDSVLRV